MTENELPLMAPGGVWLHHNGNPHYVLEDTIQRLLNEGAYPIDDPRERTSELVNEKPAKRGKTKIEKDTV